MKNFESTLRRALTEISKNSNLKELKSLPVYFVINYGAIKWTEQKKNELIKLIKEDKITIFEALYTKLDKKSKEKVDKCLEDKEFFLSYTIGLPEENK